MNFLLALGLLLGQTCCPTGTEGEEFFGTLWPGEGKVENPTRQFYRPGEGDVVLFSSVAPFYAVTYAIARTKHPYHSGLVVRRANGELAVLEVGVAPIRNTRMLPVFTRLQIYLRGYPRARVWVRQNRVPLTPEQSARLTAFAERELGKPFSSKARLAALSLPFRPGRVFQTGQPDWFCSEIVVEGLVRAGILDPGQTRASAVFPRDLFYDKGRFVNLAPRWAAPIVWSDNLSPPPPGPHCAPR